MSACCREPVAYINCVSDAQPCGTAKRLMQIYETGPEIVGKIAGGQLPADGRDWWMTETDSQPIAKNEQVKELLHMKGGIWLDQEPLPQIHLIRDTDLSVFAYELHIFAGDFLRECEFNMRSLATNNGADSIAIMGNCLLYTSRCV